MKYSVYLVFALLVSGCATGLPSVGGKTLLNLHFEDITESVQNADGTVTPGERIIWDNKSKLAAGVQIKDAATLGIEVKPDNAWSINVAGDRNADTQGQMTGIIELQKQQMEALATMSETLAGLTNAVLPVVQQGLRDAATAKVESDKIKAGVVHDAVGALSGSAPAR